MEVCVHEKMIIMDKPVEIIVIDTGDGLNVLICGGDRSHIGAIAAASPETEAQVITFPGHREDVIVRRWASALSYNLNTTVTVEAGIHYDNINKEEICLILNVLEEKLQKIIKHFSENTLQIQNETI